MRSQRFSSGNAPTYPNQRNSKVVTNREGRSFPTTSRPIFCAIFEMAPQLTSSVPPCGLNVAWNCAIDPCNQVILNVDTSRNTTTNANASRFCNVSHAASLHKRRKTKFVKSGYHPHLLPDQPSFASWASCVLLRPAHWTVFAARPCHHILLTVRCAVVQCCSLRTGLSM